MANGRKGLAGIPKVDLGGIPTVQLPPQAVTPPVQSQAPQPSRAPIVPSISKFGVSIVLPEARSRELQLEAQTKAETEKALKQSGVIQRELTPEKLLEMSDVPNMFSGIEQVTNVLRELPVSAGGPVTGRVQGLNPYAVETQQAVAKTKVESQRFGRYMEGGVLRKEDEEKYFRMYPQITDVKPVAQYKGAIIKRMLAEKFNSQVDLLNAQGFNVSGLNKLPIPPLPKLGKVYSKQKEVVDLQADQISLDAQIKQLEQELGQ